MLKAYFVIRQDLEMSPAKLAVQIGHGVDFIHLMNVKSSEFERWITLYDRRKIVLRIKNIERLENLIKFLDEAQITYSKIVDKGYTEFQGQETMTGIVIHPIDEDNVPTKISKLQIWK